MRVEVTVPATLSWSAFVQLRDPDVRTCVRIPVVNPAASVGSTPPSRRAVLSGLMSSQTPGPALVQLRVWGVPTPHLPRALAHVAIDRFALAGYPGLTFAKVLGTGSGVTFAPQDADPHHWALLTCWDAPHAAATFEHSRLMNRWNAISTECVTVTMTPLASKGSWSRRRPFGDPAPPVAPPAGAPVAAITRARIKPRQLTTFWRSLPSVVAPLPEQVGLRWSLGIGEAPIGWQGTFSLWRDVDALRQFAYGTPAHRDAIRQTRDTGWFAEELFARLLVVDVQGSFNGVPIEVS